MALKTRVRALDLMGYLKPALPHLKQLWGDKFDTLMKRNNLAVTLFDQLGSLLFRLRDIQGKFKDEMTEKEIMKISEAYLAVDLCFERLQKAEIEFFSVEELMKCFETFRAEFDVMTLGLPLWVQCKDAFVLKCREALVGVLADKFGPPRIAASPLYPEIEKDAHNLMKLSLWALNSGDARRGIQLLASVISLVDVRDLHPKMEGLEHMDELLLGGDDVNFRKVVETVHLLVANDGADAMGVLAGQSLEQNCVSEHDGREIMSFINSFRDSVAAFSRLTGAHFQTVVDNRVKALVGFTSQ